MKKPISHIKVMNQIHLSILLKTIELEYFKVYNKIFFDAISIGVPFRTDDFNQYLPVFIPNAYKMYRSNMYRIRYNGEVLNLPEDVKSFNGAIPHMNETDSIFVTLELKEGSHTILYCLYGTRKQVKLVYDLNDDILQKDRPSEANEIQNLILSGNDGIMEVAGRINTMMIQFETMASEHENLLKQKVELENLIENHVQKIDSSIGRDLTTLKQSQSEIKKEIEHLKERLENLSAFAHNTDDRNLILKKTVGDMQEDLNKKISDINQNHKTLGDELRLVDSDIKNKVAQIDKRTTTETIKNFTDKAQNLQIQVNELSEEITEVKNTKKKGFWN